MSRTANTLVALVGLTSFALAAAPARAQVPAPPPAPAAAPAPTPAAVPAPAAPAEVAPAPAAVAAPAPAPVPAPVAVAAPAPVEAAAAPPARRKIQVGVSFLPMSLGKFSAVFGGMNMTLDAAFAPGFAVTAGYEVLPGLTLGVAPQVIYNVTPKEDPTMGMPIDAKQYDFMARVAYAYPVADSIALFAEVLPGYSRLVPSYGDKSTGFVLALGAGAMMDVTDRVFVNLGGGYELGFQVRESGATKTDVRTKFVRIAFGVGMRF